MYNKEELLSKSISELEDIAKELNVTLKAGASQEDIVYDIIEAQAVDLNAPALPRKTPTVFILSMVRREKTST